MIYEFKFFKFLFSLYKEEVEAGIKPVSVKLEIPTLPKFKNFLLSICITTLIL